MCEPILMNFLASFTVVQKGHHTQMFRAWLCLNVETEPDVWGKLNQWKIWKTEPMENLHQSFCTFKCRKVIMCKCPHMNVLSVETSSYLNGQSGVVTRKIIQKNFKLPPPPPKVWVSSFLSVDRNGILVLAIMKKWKNGHHFINMHCTENVQIANPLKVWVSSFLSVNRNGILVSAITKK